MQARTRVAIDELGFPSTSTLPAQYECGTRGGAVAEGSRFAHWNSTVSLACVT